RATTVVHFLTERAGFDPGSLSAVGYGEYRPISENESQEGRARNRRVDIVLLAGGAEGGEAKPRISPVVQVR
ncbi:MAG: flagellar basal body stator protein MotB, partial [Desulfuromonadaceae bacterium]|nr:flagellar basal body stator protein MotB [Desulfuromonadaceae bacterium]MDD2849511.1 flagellar basal body stator protein MotB [Desulfuromonadaceae bacterium]